MAAQGNRARVKCAPCYGRLLLAEAVQHDGRPICTDCAAEVLHGVTHPPYARAEWSTTRGGKGRVVRGGAVESNRRRH